MSPIQQLDAFDIVGVRKDGGVDLVITCHGPLDSSPETLMALEQKIRNYVQEITAAKDPTFFQRYNCLRNAEIRIIVSCAHLVEPEAMSVIERMQPLVRSINGSLIVKAQM